MNCRGRIATHFGSMEAYVSPRQIYMCVSIVERRERDRERERERDRERGKPHMRQTSGVYVHLYVILHEHNDT